MERKSDENLKTQFKERWTQTPSSELNQNWKEHSFKYRSILHNAIEADNKVMQKFATHRDKMELLSSASPTTLANAIPSGSSGNSSIQSSPVVAQLKTLISISLKCLKMNEKSLNQKSKTSHSMI